MKHAQVTVRATAVHSGGLELDFLALFGELAMMLWLVMKGAKEKALAVAA